jgi:hypothetical protein
LGIKDLYERIRGGIRFDELIAPWILSQHHSAMEGFLTIGFYLVPGDK